MISLRWSIAAAFLGVLAVGACVSISPRQTPSATPHAQARAPDIEPQSPSRPGLAVAEDSTAATSAARSHRLIDDFNNTLNGRALVIRLWNEPSSGGRFYASALVDGCASIDRSTDILKDAQPKADSVSPENHSKVIAAFDRLRARCAQFTEEEYGKYSRRALLRKNEGDDPLMASVIRLIEAGQAGVTPARTEATKAVVLAADPLVMDSVGMALALYGSPRGSYLYFDGDKQPINRDPPLAAAFYLLPCGLGLACDTTDPGLAIQCVQANQCYADRFERVRKEMTSGSAARYEETLRLYQAMLAAVAGGEFWRFIPPN